MRKVSVLGGGGRYDFVVSSVELRPEALYLVCNDQCIAIFAHGHWSTYLDMGPADEA